MKKFILPLFALMCLAQWLIPGKMIVDQEKILAGGRTYKFITAPVDPTDPFRGKYITLNFEQNHIKVVDPQEWKGAENVYVSIYDSAGFAKVSTVSMYAPEGTDYIKAKIDYVTEYNPYTLWFSYPFERFYLEESKASEAEKIYWESRLDSTQTVYAIVSVKDGNAVLEDVMINGTSIADVVRQLNQ